MDYTCNECGQTAFHGWPVDVLIGKSTGSKVSKLELRCREKTHPWWRVDTKCEKCGGVPEYLLQYRGDTDQKEYPLLKCCGKGWTPEEYRPNPFKTELSI